ncbi:hypothetical protein B5X24_HaOG213757 [Helicoverpa armigera]|uniref:Uncharacterized protein n=1 Tax=Helicoverpa armigera TaxID=29058 RepID=A0A2W1BAE5_HELAM|nr:hypothetical protein B5X24_HaOG213757 [Helicoverpa armigera]
MWRAAVACALLAVLAAPSAADSNQTACETLHSYALLNSYLLAIGDRSVSVDGLEVSVTLYWGSGPARAAAALLRAQLTHVHRYRRVRLRRGPLSTAALAAHVPFHSDANYTEQRTDATHKGNCGPRVQGRTILEWASRVNETT